MSEVKGTLLGIILAIAMFTIVFGVFEITMSNAANDVAQKVDESVSSEPDYVKPQLNE